MITFSKVVSRNEGVPDFIDLTSTNQNVPLVIFFFLYFVLNSLRVQALLG